ncbi:MAG: T9SS type A sorting domain-containing protein [Lentimicrobium sp.]
MIKILNRNAICVILVCFSFLPMIALPQASDWEWIRAFGSKGADEINSACNDTQGNLYVAGYFQDEIDLDGIKLKSKGDNDILIAKFSNKGNLLWAQQAGGSYSENLIISEYAKKIAIDSDGNVIVTGCFMWEADFNGKLLKGPGNTDIFIAKYSQEGALLWVKSFCSEQHDYLYDMDIDEENNIYLTGFLTGTFIQAPAIDDYKGSEYEGPGTTPFIAGLNAVGDLKWIRRDIGKADKTLIRVSSDRIYYAVEYSSDLLMGSEYHSVSGNKDFIVQCLTTDGILEWQHKFSSDNNEMIESLDVEEDGSMLISGKYGNIPEFKTFDINSEIRDQRTYYSKLSPDGSISWTANNNSPAFPGGTKFSRFRNNQYFSTDVFSTRINVAGNDLIPDGKWFNSYVALHDNLGKINEILVSTPGIIKAVLPIDKSEYLVCGNYLSSSQTPYQKNGEGGFIDFFIGLKKLQLKNEAMAAPGVVGPLDFDMNVFPNPAENSCTLQASNPVVAEQINITTTDGRILRNYFNCELPFKINLVGLASGIYLLSLKSGDVITSKILTIK